MPIILAMGRTVKGYLRLFGQHSPELRLACPHCGGATHLHGRYWRSAVTNRKVHQIPIYRWRCSTCKRTFSVLPDFLIPYAQFVSLVREGVLRRRARGQTTGEIAMRTCKAGAGGLSTRTVARWLARMREVASEWAKVLARRLLSLAPGVEIFSGGSRWRGPGGSLQALCSLGDECHRQAPTGQAHPGLLAYCSGLDCGLPRL